MKDHSDFVVGQIYRRKGQSPLVSKFKCVGHLEDGRTLVEDLNDPGEVKYIQKPHEWEEMPKIKKKTWWLNIYSDNIAIHESQAQAFKYSTSRLLETRAISVEWEDKE